MAQELVQICHGSGLHCYQLGWSRRFGQVRRVRGLFRLVGLLRDIGRYGGTNAIFSVPLCYVYPAMLHYKACARTRRQKLADIAMIIFGTIAAVYTSAQTIKVGRLDFIPRSHC